MLLLRDAEEREAALDAALSHALLLRVAQGELPDTLRVYRPAATVAFGRRDTFADGFDGAVAAARTHGFTPVLRSPGGRPAAYDAGSVLFDLVVRADSPLTGAQETFAATSEALAGELRALGVDAHVGAVEGEYCRGEFSINAGGTVKIVGTAQRRIRGAALLAGVVTADGAERLRAVVRDVYAALGIEWRPSSLGAVAGLPPPAVERAVIGALAPDAGAPAPLDEATVALGRQLESAHRIG